MTGGDFRGSFPIKASGPGTAITRSTQTGARQVGSQPRFSDAHTHDAALNRHSTAPANDRLN